MPSGMLPDTDRSLLFTPQALPSACAPRSPCPARRAPAGRCPTRTRAPARRLPRSCAALRVSARRRPPSGLRLQETGASTPHPPLVPPWAHPQGGRCAPAAPSFPISARKLARLPLLHAQRALVPAHFGVRLTISECTPRSQKPSLRSLSAPRSSDCITRPGRALRAPGSARAAPLQLPRARLAGGWASLPFIVVLCSLPFTCLFKEGRDED